VELREENIKGMKIDEHGWFVWCYFYLYSILLLGFSPPKFHKFFMQYTTVPKIIIKSCFI
jgi:hypothetical protein